ncbi:hypothetical protein [Altererythrobacter litoralis]|uniref:Uncharacterized protein n=1 Tax=Altererythrobacter litoralis TaxID=3113904 RepID=A0ABU7GBC2_9SPHN|nr:hypothetical protein [Erythrobacteraceae bacterium 1XM1-14]
MSEEQRGIGANVARRFAVASENPSVSVNALVRDVQPDLRAFPCRQVLEGDQVVFHPTKQGLNPQR